MRIMSMKKPTGIQALYVASLFALAGTSAHAELKAMKQQAIVEDAITPEEDADAQDEAPVEQVERKAPAMQRAQVQEREEFALPADEARPVLAAAAPVAPPPAEKPTAGSQLDQGIKAKMSDVQSQFETALLKTLDRVKVTVDDGAPAQGANATTQTVVVQDSLVTGQSAPDRSNYISVDAAPEVSGDEADGTSVAADAEKPKSERKVRVAPVFGKSVINSSAYNVNSHYTAGFEIEMDIDPSFALVLGYAYSQYDIGLATGGSFYNYYQPYGFNGANSTSLQYNQNVFNAGARLYLMPKEAKFRVYGGAGVGYNLGYLNYRQDNSSSYLYNPYYNTPDYEVKSWLGLLETGASVGVSETVSVGAIFKYALVFSSTENAPLNNYAFTRNFGYGQASDKAVVGGSNDQKSINSILGTKNEAI
jgi:hypothetical protein